VAAALAVASALSATIWQRRVRLAALKIQGFDYRQLWRALLLESLILLGIGCTVGIVFGMYGHALASRWLERATGFPAPFSLGGSQVLLTFALVTGIAIFVVALPGYTAARDGSYEFSGVDMAMDRLSRARRPSHGGINWEQHGDRRGLYECGGSLLARSVPHVVTRRATGAAGLRRSPTRCCAARRS
jgi:hypothetical protein